ncbi:MAG: hypothetical protein WC389_18020 [Lutibacter sp.]|jgi:hypothetical protein
MKILRYIYGWILVRPRRWFFRNMICAAYPQWKIKKEYDGRWSMPNIHWHILYMTIFKFFKWLYYDGWRPFCDWTGGYRRTFPLIARIIHKIGQTTSGYTISSGECFHCGSDAGDQFELSEDETGKYFKLIDYGTSYTPDGTDHWFRGITICPKCGHKEEYSDSSL